MKLWIEDPVEPRELVLAWQAPDGVPDRRRWAVGLLERGVSQPTFRYFSATEVEERNGGRDAGMLRQQGFAGYPAFRFELGRCYREQVLETFARRIPPASRADFPKYLEYFSIMPGSASDLFTLLGLTEARLPGDGFSLVDPLSPALERGEITFEIAGYRHEAPDIATEIGDKLTLRADPDNVWDDFAVAVFSGDVRLGFVNRIQAPVVGGWLASRHTECRLLRFNGRRGAPRAYALLKVWPSGSQMAA